MPLTDAKMKAWHAVHKAYSSEVAAALPKKKKVKVLFPPKEEEVAEPVKKKKVKVLFPPKEEEVAKPEAAAPASKVQNTTYPLVSKEEYLRNLKMLRSVFNSKKVPVKDRPLEAEIKEAFFRDGAFHGKKIVAMAFLNGLIAIYNDTMKRKERFSKPPTPLEWLDWFDARKTDQTDGMVWALSDNYRMGGLEYYFNIYPNSKGKSEEFHYKEYGYFYGFS